MFERGKGLRMLAVALVLVAAACGGDEPGLEFESGGTGFPAGDQLDETPDPASEPPLEVGTCFDRSDQGARVVIDDVEVSCTGPHDAELIEVFEPPTEIIPENPTSFDADLFPPCVAAAEEALGEPLAGARLTVAFTADGDPGGPYESDVNCFMISPVSGGLLAPLDSGPIDAITGDYVMLADLNVGDCFRLSEDTSAGFLIDCSDPEALSFIGSFALPDGPFPGENKLNELRNDGCAEFLAVTGASPEGLTISGTPPSRIAWEYFGFRTVTCDVGAA